LRAKALAISVHTLRSREQGRRKPEGPRSAGHIHEESPDRTALGPRLM
jgi:hypothetical protein